LFRAMSTGSKEPLATTTSSSAAAVAADGVAIYYIHAGTLSTDASASDGGGDSFG